ncbi:polypeptide N-acetylgalactosaminyltransferase 4-like [Condylostylus longicornis]|uniref:polypeptide N-acetylgalactosaminyltransferase 4-like n=1 Tax=Condylostylus longicornis TaxID=2530218 RepID=UPI00244E1BC9|nr:polypeptide N-acetylgalactosaminyltransferase 4-like [Condylostylus longicornis]
MRRQSIAVSNDDLPKVAAVELFVNTTQSPHRPPIQAAIHVPQETRSPPSPPTPVPQENPQQPSRPLFIKYPNSAETLEEALARKAVPKIAGRPDESHLHGMVGVGPDGEAIWKPKPLSAFRMTHDQKVEAHAGYCFNTKVAESLPLDRPIPDYNSASCRGVQYPATLQPASVIIVFYNENFSVLLRSFHSVLNRTPPHLLNEVIIVDDFSNSTTHPWLFEELDNYLQYVPKVVVRRLHRRHGLMMARMAGVEWATAPTVVFLDSHIECADRWIEPLVHATQKDRKTIVVPMIHTIDFDNFGFESGHLDVLGFSWSLGQTHPYRSHSDFAPMPSPVMAGGLFAADKSWFLELGGYDPEMRLYGGEEMEIGFKVWMCGGRLEALPCSRVGHVFRSGLYWNHQVYRVPGEEIHRNKLRTAEVWMDDYAKIAKIAIPKLPDDMSIGPLDEVKAVRQRLQCKSFKWYLENVFPDLKVPKIEGGKAGAIRNPNLNACIDSLLLKSSGSPVGAYPCHHQHGTQAFLHDADGFIRIADTDFKLCLRAGKDGLIGWASGDNHVTATDNCDTHEWIYQSDTKQLKAKRSLDGQQTAKCLQVVKQETPKSPFDLLVADCSDESKYQKWEYDPVE